MVHMSLIYEGGLRCLATHGPSGATLQTDAPMDNHGRGEAFSPTDLVATGLAACIATTMGIVATRHRWDITGMRLEVTKEMSKDTPRRIVRLSTDVWLPIARATDPNRLLERAAATCPVHRSLHPDVEKPVVFHYQDERGAGEEER